MDYAKIYADFIRDRRKSEAARIASGISMERHHIRPRSLGGANNNANVIRLSAREHAFAHACLLKAYPAGSEEHWFMAASMTAVLNFRKATRPAGFNAWAQRRYSWARKLHASSINGRAHPGYKDEVFTLWHIDGRVETGTRQDLIERTGMGFRFVYDLACGVRTMCLGWCVSEVEATNRRVAIEVAMRGDLRDETGSLSIYHTDGRIMSGRCGELARTLGVHRNRVLAMAKGRLTHANGWCLTQHEAKARAAGTWIQTRRTRALKDHLLSQSQ